jgi:hypothetical protein
VYASSSSALATGSALSFDGTNLSVTSPSTATTFTLADNGGRNVVLKNSLGTGGNAEVGTTTNHDFYVRAGAGSAGLNSLYLQAGNVTGYSLSYAGLHTWSAGGSERMRLDTSGNLLVGTTSAISKLTVQGASDVRITVNESGNSVRADLICQTSQAIVGTQSSHPFDIMTGGTGRVRISTAGGFSVGTTSDPGAGAIYATGNITAFFSSDIKFKENVRDIPNALATVNAIGGKLFDWTDDYIESKGGADGYFVQKADFGVVAQDVQKVFPIAVRTRDDGSLAVDYEKLGVLAFAALVEFTKRVEALDAK